jgi:hypothetical protein
MVSFAVRRRGTLFILVLSVGALAGAVLSCRLERGSRIKRHDKARDGIGTILCGWWMDGYLKVAVSAS